jgi:hypothetical protein
VAVIAIPKRPPAAQDVDLAEYARLKAFLKEKEISFFEGYDEPGRIWINPLTFGLPDIVFLPQPYAHTQSCLYHSFYLKHFCKLAIYDYGMQVANMDYMYYLPFMKIANTSFWKARPNRRLYLEHVPKLRGKLIVTGILNWMCIAIRFLPKCIYGNCRRQGNESFGPRILRLRTIELHIRSQIFSSIMSSSWLRAEPPDIEFVLRPHPELFEYMVAVGMKTREESTSYRDRFNALPNGQVYEGGDIFYDVQAVGCTHPGLYQLSSGIPAKREDRFVFWTALAPASQPHGGTPAPFLLHRVG